jgi:hypothetical protein
MPYFCRDCGGCIRGFIFDFLQLSYGAEGAKLWATINIHRINRFTLFLKSDGVRDLQEI